jgi:hypothetical protein
VGHLTKSIHLFHAVSFISKARPVIMTGRYPPIESPVASAVNIEALANTGSPPYSGRHIAGHTVVGSTGTVDMFDTVGPSSSNSQQASAHRPSSKPGLALHVAWYDLSRISPPIGDER